MFFIWFYFFFGFISILIFVISILILILLFFLLITRLKGADLRRVARFDKEVRCLAVSPDGSLLGVGLDDGNIAIILVSEDWQQVCFHYVDYILVLYMYLFYDMPWCMVA